MPKPINKWFKAALFSFVTITLNGCNTDSTAKIQFEVVNPESIGIDFIHNNDHKQQFKYPQIMSAGVAVLDYDLDGDLDIYFNQAAPAQSDQLYKSLYIETGTLTFSNVTKQLGIEQHTFGMGVSIGDYNNDTYPDILLSNVGHNVLLKNKQGLGFEDVSVETGLNNESKLSIVAAFVDLNQDQWLDIVTVNAIKYDSDNEPQCQQLMGPDYCGPNSHEFEANSIYYNDKTYFKLLTSNRTQLTNKSPSLGITTFDANQDGLTDIYIANDTKANTLWINNGDFKFSESAISSGVALNSMAKTEASMGIAIGDMDNNGLLDLFLSHMWQETNTLYTQSDRQRFEDRTMVYKLAASSRQHTGFGTTFMDFDNDGDLDLAVANGGIMRSKENQYAETNLFYENIGTEFSVLNNSEILSHDHRNNSRGLIRADLDNDGDSDIIIANNNSKPEIYINQTTSNNNWLGYVAVDENDLIAENTESIVKYGEKSVHNIQTRNGSYASSADPRVLMGLGQYNSEIQVTIRWSQDSFEKFVLQANKYHRLQKGQGLRSTPWANINAKDNRTSTEQRPDFVEIIDTLLAAEHLSAAQKSHLSSLRSNKVTLEMCYSLQSYELNNEASLCYQHYFDTDETFTGDTYYLAAINDINRFSYQLAESYLDKAIELNPKQWLYCIRKTQLLYIKQQYNKADIHLSICKKLKDHIFNEKIQADIFLAKKQYKKAFNAYRTVLKDQPQANNLYHKLAAALEHFQSQNLVDLALKKAGQRKLLLPDPILSHLIFYNKDAEFHYKKSILVNNTDPKAALVAMKRAYELQTNSEKIYRNLALLLVNNKQLAQAQGVLLAHINDFTLAETFLVYGSVLTQLRNMKKAQDIYKQGLVLHPNNIDLLTNIGNNHLRQKEYGAASNYYNMILIIDQNNNNAKLGLKLIQEQQH
jgi:tetratricopeptide (TPR) repeat protein